PGDAVFAAFMEQDREDPSLSLARLVNRRPFSASWEYHLDQALFTSPPLDQHSGAPLFNQRGELLGIGSLRVSNTLPASSTATRALPGNMFVPVDVLRPIIEEMRSKGTSALSHRPWLGLNSSEQHGRVQVNSVTQGGPAQSAGIGPGDLILTVDGIKVASLEGFYKRLWAHTDAASPVTLGVMQGVEMRSVEIKVVERLSTLRRPDGI
ncbi:MAG: hypothetical protein RLZZ401_907, partial [Pseudomonadota bacterium]